MVDAVEAHAKGFHLAGCVTDTIGDIAQKHSEGLGHEMRAVEIVGIFFEFWNLDALLSARVMSLR